MIQQVSLNHGFIPYQFMLHRDKLEVLKTTELSPLRNYLRESFANCPREPFVTGPRSSGLKFDIGIKPERVENHEVCFLAKNALLWNKFSQAHSNVQVFMLSNDTKTFSAEVPVWLEEQRTAELAREHKLELAKGPLSGHIDLLRHEENKIWVWDYKPKAEKEKYASTQVYFYAKMLSERAKIPINKFMCGYFDDKDCFVFKPE